MMICKDMNTICRGIRYRFGKSLVNIIMMEDFPQVGFEGQRVKVRPG